MRQVAARARARRPSLRLAGTGFWAVMDQGLFALSNFVLNVMLARWLGPGEYGVFGVTYSVFLLLGTVHTAFVSEPLLVYGSGRNKPRFASYLRAVVRGHWWLAAGCSVVLVVVAGAAAAAGSDALAGTMVAGAAAAPLVLLAWMLRKACYVHLRPRVAATAGAVYLVLIVGGASVLRVVGALSATTGLVLMAAASAVAVLMLWDHLRRYEDVDPALDRRAMLLEAMQTHWRYGRWGVGAVGLGWLSVELYYVVLTTLHGFEATGELRAIMNLVVPANMALIALGTVALPLLVNARAAGTFARTVLLMLWSFVGMGAAYAGILVLFGDALVGMLFGAAYLHLTPVLAVLALFPVIAAAGRVFTSALHALEYPRGNFIGHLPPAFLSLTVGLLLTNAYGVPGAAVSVLIAVGATALTLGIVLLRRLATVGAAAPDLPT